jgi:hypothetical protein
MRIRMRPLRECRFHGNQDVAQVDTTHESRRSIALRGADKHISNFGKYTIARLINGSLKQNVDRNA